MSAPQPVPRPPDNHEAGDEDDDLLDADDAAEEIEDEDPDHPMDEDDDEGEDEIQLQNDSAAHFDTHKDSIFCIAQHPTNPNIVVTGGGDDLAYVFNASIPATAQEKPQGERAGIEPLQKLDGHKDSVNAVTFTYPRGEYVVTAGLDGKLRAWHASDPSGTKPWSFVAETAEVEEINWVAACPTTTDSENQNIIALGANDGSVWVYRIDAEDTASPLTIVQAFYLHTASCTAGAWTPDGKLLATVSEDGSLYVWDVFSTGSAIITHTAADQRFEVEGGLYSVTCTTALVAVGGGNGQIKVVGLPQAGSSSQDGKKPSAKQSSSSNSSSSSGQILASLQAQTDGIETLSFSSPPLTILAAGSVDGSIALFDTAHRFALRRHIKEAHEEYAVVKVEFVRGPSTPWLLTSAGMDGVVRRWDVRGGTTAAGQGFVREWRGHRGEGEGGGVLGFVQGGGGNRIVTAGDDSVSLVFRTDGH